MAINRDAMIQSVFVGHAVKSWSMPTAAEKVWHDSDIVRHDYNPSEAKHLLASLGWRDRNGDGVIEDRDGNAVRFTLKTNSNNLLRVAMATSIKDDLAKIGIAVSIVPSEFNTLVTNYRHDFQYDAMLLGFRTGAPPTPGPVQFWRSSGISHLWNVSQPSADTAEEARNDRLMDIAWSAADLGARKAAFTELRNIVNQQTWIVWLPSEVIKVAVRNRFRNIQPTVFSNNLLDRIDQVYVASSLPH